MVRTVNDSIMWIGECGAKIDIVLNKIEVGKQLIFFCIDSNLLFIYFKIISPHARQ